MGGSDIPYKVELPIDTLQPEEQMVQFSEKERIDQIFVGIEKNIQGGQTGIRVHRSVYDIKSPVAGGYDKITLRQLRISYVFHA